MDLTPFLSKAEHGSPEENLESLLIPGRVAVAAKGRFLLRSLCRSFGGEPRITGAVTDQESCLGYLAAQANDPYTLLVCTDDLESGNGFDLIRRRPPAASKAADGDPGPRGCDPSGMLGRPLAPGRAQRNALRHDPGLNAGSLTPNGGIAPEPG